MGVQVVATLTYKSMLNEIESVASAETSLLLSHDAGKKASDYLSSEFNVEQICQGIPLPIGMTNTRRWILELGKRFEVQGIAKRLVAEGEKIVVETYRRKGGYFFEVARFQRTPTAIVADATVGIPLVRFTIEELELKPELIALRSSRPDAREILEREVDDLGISPKIVYGTDVYKMKKSLEEISPEVVFGSNIERHAIEELWTPYIFEVVSPMRRFRVIDKAYFGYNGILNLLEVVQNEFADRWRSKEKRYKARW